MSLNIIIAGCGLIGNATALALLKAGHRCTIYDQLNPFELIAAAEGKEKYIEFGETGGSVALGSNSLRVMRELGVMDEVFEHSYPCGATHYHKIDGSSPIVLDLELLGSRIETEKQFFCVRQIMQSKLHSILSIAAQKAGAKIYVGKKVVKVEQTESTVIVTFKDGTAAQGHLLIGADGIHSAVRTQIFGENCVARFSGTIGYIGVCYYKKHNIAFDQNISFYIDRANKRVITAFKVSEEIATLQASVINDVKETQEAYRPYSDLPKHSKELADMLVGWGVPKNISEMMRNAHRISPANLYELPDLPSYHSGRVLLIGDAAHGMLPNAGLGLSTGFDDIGVLLELLKALPDPEDLDKILRVYSEIRPSRAAKNAEFSRVMADQNYSTAFGANGSHFVHRLFVTAIHWNLIKSYGAPDNYAALVKDQLVKDGLLSA